MHRKRPLVLWMRKQRFLAKKHNLLFAVKLSIPKKQKLYGKQQALRGGEKPT